MLVWEWRACREIDQASLLCLKFPQRVSVNSLQMIFSPCEPGTNGPQWGRWLATGKEGDVSCNSSRAPVTRATKGHATISILSFLDRTKSDFVRSHD